MPETSSEEKEWKKFLDFLSERDEDAQTNQDLASILKFFRTEDRHFPCGENRRELFRLELLARYNDVWAIEALYTIYKNGWFVKKSFLEYLRWLMRGADHGIVSAMIELAELLAKGNECCPKNVRRSYVYFSKAAILLDPYAFCRTGDFYRDGLYVTEDPKTAFTLYRYAEDRSEVISCCDDVKKEIYQRLAECCQKGIGTPCDMDQAGHYRNMLVKKERKSDERQ